VPDIATGHPEVNLPMGAQPAAEMLPLKVVVEFTERKHIVNVLKRVGGSVSRAAEVLKISRKSLWEKMKRHGVDKANY
jgi:DNA-binding NtrC family response regulator